MYKKKGKYDNIMCWAPVLMVLIGIALFLIILPARYDKVVSFFDWLFSGTDNIIATLRSSQTVLPHYYRILVTKFVIWLWTIGFLVSLFMCGRILHRGALPDNNVLRVDYSLKTDIVESINLCKNGTNIKKSQQKAICDELYMLLEKFMAQKAFGYGNSEMTDFENDICKRVFTLLDKIKESNCGESHIEAVIVDINVVRSMLDKRAIMLKK